MTHPPQQPDDLSGPDSADLTIRFFVRSVNMLTSSLSDEG